MKCRSRSGRIAIVTALAGLVLFVGGQLSAADRIERTVEFRDGTILRVLLPDEPLPWHIASRDGSVAEKPLSWKEIDRIYLVPTPALEKLAEIKKLLTDLSNNDFLTRVDSHKQLIDKGIHFRGVLQQVFKTTEDPEVRWRLESVLRAMPDNAEPTHYNYDLLYADTEGGALEGDIGNWQVEGLYRGIPLTINRKQVCRISRAMPVGMSAHQPTVGTFERITEDNDDLFPKNVTRVNFDRGPAGELLVPGRDIKETFAPLGVTLHSSYENSFISVQDYNVRGRSGGLCAANFEPLYNGTITCRFCLPGNAGVPAGVTYVGLWVAYIEPNGTALQAFDVHDRLIGEVKTTTRGRDFLSIKSNTPIAYVKITPDETIDKDHAIDDLVFDPPMTLVESSDPKWLTVQLTGGQRVKCQSLSREKDEVTLRDLSLGLAEVKAKLSEIVSVMPATETILPPADEAQCMVMLDDGSVLRAKADGGLKSIAGEPIQPERLVALWGLKSAVTLPEENAWPEKGALLIDKDKHFKTLPEWKLGEKWLEAEGLDLYEYSYADTPIVWFRKPVEVPEGAGIVRLSGGEELVLDAKAGYTLSAWTPELITLTRDGTKREVPFSRVLALRLPTP